jgi:hypothetical protein
MNRVLTATRLGFLEQARRPLLVILLVGLPFFFITRAIASTEKLPRQVQLPGGGWVLTNMRDIHGASMAAITVAFLCGLVGVFVMQSAVGADRRLVVAGFRPWQALLPRLLVLATATALVLTVSLAVTALSFTPKLWLPVIAGTLAVGLVYGLLGALAGAFVSRLGAMYLMLFGAMLDIGIAQDPMFGSGAPPDWAALLPGYGPGRMIIDGALSSQFHAWSAALIALGWVGLLTAAVITLLARRIRLAGG